MNELELIQLLVCPFVFTYINPVSVLVGLWTDYLTVSKCCDTSQDLVQFESCHLMKKNTCEKWLMAKRIITETFLNFVIITLPADNLQCGAVITRSIFSQIFTKGTHSSPVRAKYGVCFVGQPSDWHSASVPAIIYAISYYTGPHYNGTRLWHGMVRFMTPYDGIKSQWVMVVECPGLSVFKHIHGAYHLVTIVRTATLVPSHPCQVTTTRMKIRYPLNEIYRYLIFKWIKVTWLQNRGPL